MPALVPAGAVAQRGAAGDLAVLGSFVHAAGNVFGQFGAEIFGHGFDHALSDDPRAAVRYELCHTDKVNPGRFQLLAVKGAFGTVTEKPVIAPDQHTIHHAGAGVADKPPEVRPVLSPCTAGAVYVLPYHGNIMFFGVLPANINLRLYA